MDRSCCLARYLSNGECFETETQTKTVSSPKSLATKSDNLAPLLEQGLQIKDVLILDSVLLNCDQQIITSTIRRLPIHFTVALLSECQKRLCSGDKASAALKWLEALLTLRLSFITTLPNFEDMLEPVMEILDAKSDILERILKLKGRLNLLFSQIQQINKPDVINGKAQINYESSSSEEEDPIEMDEMDLANIIDNEDTEQSSLSNITEDESEDDDESDDFHSHTEEPTSDTEEMPAENFETDDDE